MALAELVLAGHVAVIAFNLFGLFAIPLGALLGWTFVRAPLWRALHVASLGVVALQALAGQACFLTTWQADLSGAQDREPLIMRWVNGMIFWPLPLWAFSAAYVAIFVYVVALLWIVPPRRWERPADAGRARH
jgi:hypothetical protein